MAVNMGIGTTDVSEPAFTPGGTRRRQVRARFTGGGCVCVCVCVCVFVWDAGVK